MLGSTNFWLRKNWGPKKSLGPNNFGVQKRLGQTRCWSKKIKAPKILDQRCLAKTGSVTAEISFIWINVARTIVACINVTMTVGIC